MLLEWDGAPKPPGLAWMRKVLGEDFFAKVLWCGVEEGTDLKHVKELTNLAYLDLSETQIADAGLDDLKGLTNLAFLDLREAQVTDEGVKKLQQALPNCEISH